MRLRILPLGLVGLLLAGIVLLYFPWRHNLPFFDDLYFYADIQTHPDRYASPFAQVNIFERRWLMTLSMGLTWLEWGTIPGAYRLTSLLLHCLVSASLFLFLRDLLKQESGSKEADVAAFAGAMLFALNPVAVFAVGYIIERSILLASLFSLWMWIAVHRGVSQGGRAWPWLSALFFYFAVYSKEHAITALGVAVLVAWLAADGDRRKTVKALLLPVPLWGGVAAMVLLSTGAIIGQAYEPNLGEMLDGQDPHSLSFYARSVVNQGYQFFHYGLFWLLPMETWMSLDMRPPFPSVWYAMPWLGGFLAFLFYPFAALVAVRKNHLSRLAAVALVSPWLLFLTMFSTVQYQESFVLYRSYLWALPGALLPALLLVRLPLSRQLAFIGLVGLVLFGLSWSRLQTFSHPSHIWREAVDRLEGRMDLPGSYRIYHNRGVEYFELGEMNRALADFNTVLSMKPGFSYSLHGRGNLFLGMGKVEDAYADLNQAIVNNPKVPRFYVSRGDVLARLGRRNEAIADYVVACQFNLGCEKLKAMATPDKK